MMFPVFQEKDRFLRNFVETFNVFEMLFIFRVFCCNLFFVKRSINNPERPFSWILIFSSDLLICQ